MNLERLKAQQEALQAHSSYREQLRVLEDSFSASSVLHDAIIREFARLGLLATTTLGGCDLVVRVLPSERDVSIEALTSLDFNKDLLRSEFVVFRYANGLQSGAKRTAVVPRVPMALPIEIRVRNTGRLSTIWWRGPSDSERLARIVVEMFQGQRGPEEIGPSYIGGCFVATAVFGERSEEVVVLRRWRDERLLASIIGQSMVKVYYRLGPSCASVVKRHAILRRFIQTLLSALCARLRKQPHLHCVSRWHGDAECSQGCVGPASDRRLPVPPHCRILHARPNSRMEPTRH